jgi:hypothetical protein
MLKRSGPPSLCVIFILSLFMGSLAHAKTYKWDDFTKPLKLNVSGIVFGKVVTVELNLPDFTENYEELTLIIEASGGSPYGGSREQKDLTVNDKAKYKFAVPFERDVIQRINIKTEYLNNGLNRFSFRGSGNTIESGYTITQLSFDISALKNLENYIAKPIKSKPVEKKAKKQYSQKPQDDRGIKIQRKRFALVIGNGAYRSSPLRNTVNDAEDITKNLRQLGFKVIFQKDIDQRKMEDAIRYFGKQLRDGGVGLFYFAGHGMQVNGRNYLIPIDARIESESDIKYEAVDAGRVLGKMEDAGNQLNIVILDACRNNPYARSFRMEQNGLARMDAPTGSIIAYSTAPGEVAADGTGRNGIFTKHLIRHMTTPNLSIEHVLKRVRIDVARETNERQIPWESSSLMGDFYFNADKSIASVEKEYTPKAPPTSPSDTQTASIPDDNQRNIEPWTGTWQVEGGRMLSGLWAMRQNGNIVKSTSDSLYVFNGAAEGDKLNIVLQSEASSIIRLEIFISSDGQSFEGKSVGGGVPWHVKGKRQSATESSSETQIAAISDSNLHNIEPWTGNWQIDASGRFDGPWAMKQNGKMVKSTSESLYEFEGVAEGNQLIGTLHWDTSGRISFEIYMSSDGQSLEGKLWSLDARTYYLKGKRIE